MSDVPAWNDSESSHTRLSARPHDMSPPLVSIITPSFNQAQFIRETIESVLAQDYPNIEYWVIDGGSTDGTVAILREYEADPRFRWISERDRGQTDAINKGWARCKGDILCWLNSDDCYVNESAVGSQVATLARSPAAGLVYGDGYYTDRQGAILSAFATRPYSYETLLSMNYVVQPTVFIRHDVIRRAGPLDESFDFAMDRDYWLRCAMLTDFAHNPAPIATYRLHDESKTVSSELALNIDVFAATCKHLAREGARRSTKRQKQRILSTMLLTLAIRAVRMNDDDFALQLLRGVTKLSWWNPRYLQLLLALIDTRFGWGVERRLADALYFVLHPELSRR